MDKRENIPAPAQAFSSPVPLAGTGEGAAYSRPSAPLGAGGYWDTAWGPKASQMPTSALLERGNVLSRIKGLPQHLVGLVDEATCYLTDPAAASEWRPPEALFGERFWDGKVHLASFPDSNTVVFPSGLLQTITECLERNAVRLECIDHRIRPEPGVPDPPRQTLRDYQTVAVQNALARGYGVLDMPPRAGKTRTMMEIQRLIALPTLWIAPTKNIVAQTVAAAEQFFGRNYAAAAVGAKVVEAPIVVCTSATAATLPQEFLDRRQVLVLDEFHHAAAASMRSLMLRTHHIFHRYGMTGTNYRSGNDDLALHSVLSDVVFRISARELCDRQYLVPSDVVFLPITGPRVSGGGGNFVTGAGRHGIYAHEVRNQMAAWAAGTLWAAGRSVVVLVGTKEQGRTIEGILNATIPAGGGAYRAVEFVSTDRPASLCQSIIEDFASGTSVRILIGTSMIGEGTDLPVADALVYAVGGKAEVSHAQATYRVCTAVPGKRRSVIVDFADRHNETLLRHSLERLDTYQKQEIFQTRVLEDARSFADWLRAS